MNNWLTSDERRYDSIYRRPPINLYSDRLLRGMSSGFSYELGMRDNHNGFLRFDPTDCPLRNAIRAKSDWEYKHQLGRVIDRVAYDVIVYNQAYVYIDGVDDGSSIELINKRGFIKKKRGNTAILVVKQGDRCEEVSIDPCRMVIFRINEIGYRKNYFTDLVRRLGKYDISRGISLSSDPECNYDARLHADHLRRELLKATKSLGWHWGTDDLSDAYILYKKIQMQEYKIRLLNYILNKLNEGITAVYGQNCGRICADIRELDYKDLWAQYQKGTITPSELTGILYHQ